MNQIILAGFATTALLALGACSKERDWNTQQNTAVCTDRNTGQRVDDNNCRRGYNDGSRGMGHAFLWYYMGRNSVIPYYGQHVYGGGYYRSPGTSYYQAPSYTRSTESSAVSRGTASSSSMARSEGSSVSRAGFGSSAHSYGGGGS